MQKTPENLKECISKSGEKIREKLSPDEEANEDAKTDYSNTNSVSSKEVVTKTEFEFRTPEKTRECDSVNHSVENDLKKNKTPEKNITSDNLNFKSEHISCEGEDGMISTTEQARLLIAANKTPSKHLNKTPVKQRTPNGKRSVENSPVTPGKYKRVDLITLASPKAKRIKQI